MIAFVQERFSVSGEPECVWLERNGLKLKLALDLWNDYAGAFVGNKLVVQFPGVVNDAEGGEDVCYIFLVYVGSLFKLQRRHFQEAAWC